MSGLGYAMVPDTLMGCCALCGYPFAADDPVWVVREVADHLWSAHGVVAS